MLRVYCCKPLLSELPFLGVEGHLFSFVCFFLPGDDVPQEALLTLESTFFSFFSPSLVSTHQARIVWISAGDERVGFETSKSEDADLMYQAICILVDRCHV